jgi:hypothetical protein
VEIQEPPRVGSNVSVEYRDELYVGQAGAPRFLLSKF